MNKIGRVYIWEYNNQKVPYVIIDYSADENIMVLCKGYFHVFSKDSCKKDLELE